MKQSGSQESKILKWIPFLHSITKGMLSLTTKYLRTYVACIEKSDKAGQAV